MNDHVALETSIIKKMETGNSNNIFNDSLTSFDLLVILQFFSQKTYTIPFLQKICRRNIMILLLFPSKPQPAITMTIKF